MCHWYYLSDMHRMLWEHRESVSYFSVSLVGWWRSQEAKCEGQVLVLSGVLGTCDAPSPYLWILIGSP